MLILKIVFQHVAYGVEKRACNKSILLCWKTKQKPHPKIQSQPTQTTPQVLVKEKADDKRLITA